jgi:hypothetical protein
MLIHVVSTGLSFQLYDRSASSVIVLGLSVAFEMERI